MKFWLAMAVCLLHFAVNAAEVTADEAREAVAGWAALQEALAGEQPTGSDLIATVNCHSRFSLS